MTDLTPICALGGTTPRVATFGAVRMAENPDLVLTSVAGSGLDLPGPGQFANGAFWTGPDQWMLERPAPEGALTTDQTDAWVVLEIEGNIEPLLEKLVNIDPARIAPGHATRTALEHMGVFVIRRSATQVAVLGMRSAAGSLWQALEIAAKRLETA